MCRRKDFRQKIKKTEYDELSLAERNRYDRIVKIQDYYAQGYTQTSIIKLMKLTHNTVGKYAKGDPYKLCQIDTSGMKAVNYESYREDIIGYLRQNMTFKEICDKITADGYTANTVIAVLDEYFPELALIWKDVTCPTSLTIMKKAAFPTEILNISKSELATAIREASKGTEGDKLANELVRAAEKSVGVREGQRTAKSKLLRLIGELEYYQHRLSEVETKLEALIAKSESGEILQSMKGIGVVISAAFLGEVGDANRFEDWKQLRRLAGLNLVEDSSGKHKSKTKISKRGRPYLRHMLYMAGISCVLHNVEMRQYYQCLRKRKANPLNKMQALVATGLKVMRVMFYMLKNQEKYNPEKALGDIRTRQIESLEVA